MNRPSSLIWVLATGSFAIGTDTFVVAGVLPGLRADLGLSVAHAGQLVTVYAVAFAVAAPVLGALLATVPRRTLLLGSLAVFVLANLWSALAGDYPALLASRVVAALGAAAYTPTAAAAAAALVPPERRGRALATVLGGVTAATVLGVPLGTWLGLDTGWRGTFVLVAALAAIAGTGLAVLLPPVPAPPAVPLRVRFGILGDREVRAVVGTTVLIFVGGFTVYTYLGPLLVTGAGADARRLAALLLVFGLAGVVGNWLGGRLTDRFGSLPVLAVALTVFAATLLVFPLLTRTTIGAAVGLAVWGVAAWSTTVPQQHRLLAAAPRAAPVAIGLNSAAVFLGIGLSGLVGALGIDAVGLSRLGLIGGAVVSLALLTVLARIRAVQTAPRPPAAGAAAQPASAAQPFASGVPTPTGVDVARVGSG